MALPRDTPARIAEDQQILAHPRPATPGPERAAWLAAYERTQRRNFEGGEHMTDPEVVETEDVETATEAADDDAEDHTVES
jgi:hypothetical protein